MARRKAVDNQVTVGKISEVSGEVNVAGRDIIKNIHIIHQRALTAVEEAAHGRKLESRLLAQGVATLADGLSAQASEVADSNTPYKGLLSYSLNEAEIFYGRNEAKIDLLTCLRQGPLTVLHAASGAGKTSLLQAGIAAQLIANGHLAIHLRSHDADPIDFIKRMFLPELVHAPALAAAPLREFLRQVCAVLGPKVNLYLLLDQFEEFFNLLKKDERQPFLESLADCLNDPSLKVRWVLALRGEALSDLTEMEAFGITPFKNRYRLSRLSRTEAGEAIIEPARRYGIHFELALIDYILNTLTTNDEVMPTHLQLVCSALIDDLPEDKTLTLAYYTQHEGGTEGILRDYLKRQLEDMPAGEQALARKVLRSLITADFQRAIKTIGEIIQELKTPGVNKKQIETMVSRLVERRLLFTQTQPITEKTFELAHDYLIKEIELEPQEQARKAAQELLDQELRTFQRHRTLLTAEHLAVIEPYQKDLRFSEEAKKLFVESQSAMVAAKRRRSRTLMILSTIAVAVSISMAVLALNANHQARISRAGELAAKSELISTTDPQQSLLLALEAMNITSPHLPVAEQALRDGLNMSSGIGLSGHKRPVSALAFSPNGQWLATGSLDATTRLWNLKNGILINSRILEGQTSAIAVIAFSSDDHWMATGSWDGTILLWNLKNLSSKPRVLYGHVDAVISLAFSPDNHWLAAGSLDTTILLWNLKADNIPDNPKSLNELSHPAYELVFSPNGNWLAVRDGIDALRLWDLAKQNPSDPPFVIKSSIVTFGFSVDSKWVATGGSDKNVYLWELNRLSIDYYHKTLFGHTDQIDSLSFSPDGRWLATGSIDKTIRLWDMTTSKIQPNSLVLKGKDPVLTVIFSTRGHWLATGDSNATTKLWDLTSLIINKDAALQPIVLHSNFGWINRVIFSPNEKWLASISSDNTASLWNLTADDPTNSPITLPNIKGSTFAFSPDGRWVGTTSYSPNITAHLWDLTRNPSDPFNILSDHIGGAGAAISPSGDWLATSSTDNKVQLWKMTDFSAAPIELTAHTSGVNAMAFNSSGNLLASGGSDHQVCLWNISSLGSSAIPNLQRCLTGYPAWISELTISPDGRWLATGSTDHTIQLKDLKATDSTNTLQVLPASGVVAALKFSPDNRWLAVGNYDSEVQLWEINNLTEPVRLSGHTDSVPAIDFSPDAHWLATGSFDGTVRLWDLTAPVPSIYLSFNSQLESAIIRLRFSPDGRWLAAASDSGKIYLWDVTSDTPLSEPTIILSGHNGLVSALVFSPSNRWLATGSEDTTIRLWDLTSNDPSQNAIIFRGHKNKITNLSFTPDGHWLISGGLDQTVRYWNMNLGEVKEMACTFAGRNFSHTEWLQYFPREAYRQTCPIWPIGD
jgi:WD40 repeat protein